MYKSHATCQLQFVIISLSLSLSLLENNVGYSVLVQCGEKIVGELTKEPKTLAVQLHANKFISDRTLAETIELEEIKHDKAARLHTAVLGTVRQHPQRYGEFISILEGNRTLYDDLLRELEVIYNKLDTHVQAPRLE